MDYKIKTRNKGYSTLPSGIFLKETLFKGWEQRFYVTQNAVAEL